MPNQWTYDDLPTFRVASRAVTTLITGNTDSDHLPVLKTKVNPKKHQTHPTSARELGRGFAVGIFHIIN